MSSHNRKGFLLSLDAIIAVGLLLSLTLFIAGLAITYSSPELQYQRLFYNSKDLITLVENAKIGQLEDFDSIKYYKSIGVLSDEDNDETLLHVIGSLWATENATLQAYAGNITADVLNKTIPQNIDYMISLGSDVIYQSSSNEPEFLSRSTAIVSGLERGKPIDGYFARVYPSRVGKIDSRYYYFGGYVGEGNITIRMDLPNFDSILNMTMELDSSDNFTMLINSQGSGTYIKQTNQTMRSSSFDVDPSYYPNLVNGTNSIEILFNSSYQSIGGGYIRITFNTSDVTQDLYDEYGDNASRKVHLPGIDGIVNLYSSIYVPGTLNSMDAFLHYRNDVSGVDAYLAFGNLTVFMSNATGEMNVTLTNQTMIGNLTDQNQDYSFFTTRTVPFRFGLRNISYVLGEAGAADVVLITDRTGSMTACDVETDYPACDSSPPYHDRRSLVAQQSDRDFVNTVLSAEGINNVGLIGYGERHGKTCSYHEISASNSSLQQRIEDYNYGGSWQDCGYTCTSCGVAGATEMLLENEVFYNLTVIEDIDRDEISLTSGISADVVLDVAVNKSRLIKSRLTLLAREEDSDEGFYQCVYLNGNYLGRVCKSSEGSEGWHTCEYPLKPEHLASGSNTVTLTRGDQSSCYGTSGQYNWYAKDVKIRAWEYNHNASISQSNASTDQINLNMADYYAEIWEDENDYPNPVDFASGMNSSDNTFGLGAGYDGWDWQPDTYGFTNDCDFNGAGSGELVIYTRYNSYDKSCSYGIEFNVTQEMYNEISSGGTAEVSFLYEWDESGSWEPDDQMWIKARITGPAGTTCEDPDDCYLGSDLDSGHPEGDATNEIYTDNDPDGDHSSSFTQDITSWIDSAGEYYLDLGGKIINSQSSERGYFRFDEISVEINSGTPTEPIAGISFPDVNMSFVKSALLSFEAQGIDPDYYDCLYVNDYHVGMIDYQEITPDTGWQEVLFDIPVIYLTQGENEIKFSGGTTSGCNRTGSSDQWSARNVNLTITYSNESYEYRRKKSMLIMTDGEANTIIGDCRNYDSGSCPAVSGWQTPSEETVSKACEAHDLYNISIHSVVFGDAGQDAEDMLLAAACCDNCSNFYTSSSADDLREIYSQIARGIINASFEAQRLEVSQDVGVISTLYPDSYITMNYSSNIDPPEYGEITVNFESPILETMSGPDLITDNDTKTREGWFYIPEYTEVLETVMTSYSSEYWTDRLYVSNESMPWTRVFWLNDYGDVNYSSIGDPFILNVPTDYINSGINNSLRIGTGFAPENGTGGSPDSRIIYTGRIGGVILEGYSDVYEKANGSTVEVYYDIDGDDISDGSTIVTVGPHPTDVFDPDNDSIDNAFMRLLDNLNMFLDANPGNIGNGTVTNPYDGGITSPDNPIDFQITPDIRFDSQSIYNVPSLWGPVELEVLVWT